MDNLPSFALDEILSYLNPDFVSLTFPLVSRGCYFYLQQDSGNIRYFSSLVNLPKDVPVTYQQYKEAVLQLFNRSQQFTAIPITGFSTTGGMDSESLTYWVGNLFEKELPPYCTKENVVNVVCAGVLSVFTESHINPEILELRKEAALLIRKNRYIRNCFPIIRPEGSEAPLSTYEEGIFIEFATSQPEMFVHRAVEDRRPILERVQYISTKLTTAQEDSVKCLLKDPALPNLLEAKIVRREVAEQMETYFCLKTVTVSREGMLSCPLETFMVFVSYSYIPVEHEEFKKYDNLVEEHDVEHLADQGLPANVLGNSPPNCLVREFRRTKDNLQPVIWGKFLNPAAECMEVTLNYVFSGKYLYIKLIRAENRMQEYGDVHEYMNIDVKYLGISGAVVTP